MAIHPNLWALAEEAVEEYLTTVRWCLDYRKEDGGCLGYPAALLMLCIVNALGTYLRNEQVTIEGTRQRITEGEPFRVLNHDVFNQNMTNDQIKIIEHTYRNLLSHNAMLAPNSWLVPGTADRAFVFGNDNAIIDVQKLQELVSRAWTKLDKTKIKNAVEKGYIPIPKPRVSQGN